MQCEICTLSCDFLQLFQKVSLKWNINEVGQQIGHAHII